MSISHRSHRLKLVGTPSVEKLQNGRFRLTFNLSPLNPRNDWYNANKDRIFADYGTLQSAEMSIDGIAPRTGEAYGDMALVNAQSAQIGDDYVVQFTYETLGNTFIQIKDDTISYTENGLRSVTRESIAAAGTDFQKTVGTSTISSQIDDETAVTCYLASYEVDDTDSSRKVTEVYIEAGILSIDKDYVSEGVCRVTTTFLVNEGTVVGPIIGRAIGDNDGLKTIAVTHMQKSDGTSLIDNSNPAVSHKMLENFTYPGTVRLDNESLTSSGGGLYSFSATDYALESPVNAKVPAVMEIHFRTTDNISYPTGYPLWNPTEWAYGESKGIAWDYVPFSISRAFRGYRTTSGYSDNDYSSVGTGPSSFKMISGRRIFSGTRFHIYVEGGPENPVAQQYTLDYRVSEAFQDLSGIKYYKHVIIRTDGTIPAQ